jgi:hypothetical protein
MASSSVNARVGSGFGRELGAIARGEGLALLAATIRWAAHETGRGEEELLDELAKNYAGPG